MELMRDLTNCLKKECDEMKYLIEEREYAIPLKVSDLNTIAIPNSEGLIRRDDASSAIKQMCGGFSFEYPPANGSTTNQITIKNGSTITCKWSTQSGSQVDYVTDMELFMDQGPRQGLIVVLWSDGVKMSQNPTSASVLIYSPSDITLPNTFLARSMANTTSGPK
ncbi:16625_t:CDS:2, partial [Gigaspora margarita]